MSSLRAYVLDPTNLNMAIERKLSILCDVSSGLVYLHSHKPTIVHRDLTCREQHITGLKTESKDIRFEMHDLWA